MARIGEMWHLVFARACAIGRRSGWQSFPRPRWSLSGAVVMAGLLALSMAVIWHSQGNAWVFCSAIVVAGQLAGAACGVPFRRMMQGALCGSLTGLLFFAYAAIT